MNTRAFAISLASLTLLPSATLAQAPELFIPVTGSEEAIVRAKNDYFLKKELYFAKRYRIVRVDPALLLQSDGSPERVTVNLFDDVELVYEVTQPMVRCGAQRFDFRAQLTNPPTSADELISLNSGLTRANAEKLHRIIYELSFSAIEFVHDPTRDRFWPTFVIRGYDYGRPGPEGRPKELKPTAETFYAFVSEITDPFSNEKYVLEPFYSDPRYHVIWQTGSSRSFVKPDDPGHEIQWPSEKLKRENEEKIRAHAEFLQSLGDNPRQATEERDLRAFRDSLDEQRSGARNQCL